MAVDGEDVALAARVGPHALQAANEHPALAETHLDIAAAVGARDVEFRRLEHGQAGHCAGEHGLDDDTPRLAQQVPTGGRPDEVAFELVEMVVEPAGVLDADVVAQVRERPR